MRNDILELKGMGVINITPNSFSDGGIHLDRDKLINTIKLFQQYKSVIIDFGFESTAPMNSAISIQEERNRFGFLIDVLKTFDVKLDWVSFDTYKIDNFKYFFSETLKIFPSAKIVLNDVSGVIDNDLFELFNDLRCFSNFFYVFSSTNVPSRNLTNSHMSFVLPSDIVEQTYAQLKKFVLFSENFPEMHGRLFLDPAFGFSKLYHQNWELLASLGDIIHRIESEFAPFPWIIGLSKKSFLRKKLEEENRPLNEIETLHKNLVGDLKTKSSSHLIFRVHSLDILF